MRKNYDFSTAGAHYAEHCARGTNVVRLDPEMAKAFPTSEAVNTAYGFSFSRRKCRTRLSRRLMISRATQAAKFHTGLRVIVRAFVRKADFD